MMSVGEEGGTVIVCVTLLAEEHTERDVSVTLMTTSGTGTAMNDMLSSLKLM